MILSLFRRYKLFFSIGIVILLIQIFLAYKSFKIPLNFSVNSSRNDKLVVITNQKPIQGDEKYINSDVQHQRDSTGDSHDTTFLSQLKFHPKCNISRDKEVVSAVSRAHSQECKELIINVACAIRSNDLYPTTLPNTCKSLNGNYIENRSLGCFKDDRKHRLLTNLYTSFKETNSPKKCIQMCLQSGYLYAGVEYGYECFCGNKEPSVDSKLPDSSCNMKCPSEPKNACGGWFALDFKLLNVILI